MILQWTQHADVGAKWATDIGADAVADRHHRGGGHTLVIEDIKGANTLDQSVLDSIHFLDRAADATDVLARPRETFALHPATLPTGGVPILGLSPVIPRL